MTERVVNERQGRAIGWTVAFLVCLLGVLALPVVDGSPSAFEADAAEVGPFVVFVAVVIVLAIAGRTSPTLSGMAAGMVAIVAIALTFATSIGIFFATMFEDYGGDVPWDGAVWAAMAAAVAGIVAVLSSGRGWRIASPTALTPVSVLGSIAVALMVIGLVVPHHGTTVESNLGFDVDPAFGALNLVMLAIFTAVGVAGFSLGRWGLGLLTGLFGYMLVGVLLSQSGDQSQTIDWSGIDGTIDYHPLAVAGFWSSLGLIVVHAVQQYSHAPTGASSDPTAAAERTARGASKVWAADPFGRFEMRYFDGRAWTEHVVTGGQRSSDPASHRPPHGATTGWYPDPYARHEQRYFDGAVWTPHVVDAGQQMQDHPQAPPPGTERAVTSAAPSPPATIGPDTGAGTWAIDPFGRFEMRYHDGRAWSEHVVRNGTQARDPARHEPPSSRTAAWHPDPFGRHQQRYFDGRNWTAHVADAGASATDEPVALPPAMR